jgi:hypothetical protein
MTESPKTATPTMRQAEAQANETGVARRARERRYLRSLEGWYASRLRAYGRGRRRGAGDEPARG